MSAIGLAGEETHGLRYRAEPPGENRDLLVESPYSDPKTIRIQLIKKWGGAGKRGHAGG